MDTSSSEHRPAPLDPRLAPKKSMFVLEDGRNVLFVFVLLILLFALWGFCNGMIDVMDKHFQEELHLSLSQSAWVQFAHYLGYFLMALPAGWLATKLGYKGGIITGLLMVAVGGFWFVPATHIAQFWAFLARRLRHCRRSHLSRNDRQSLHHRSRSDSVRGDAHQSRAIVQRHRLAPRADRGRHVFLFQERGRREHGQRESLDSLRLHRVRGHRSRDHLLLSPTCPTSRWRTIITSTIRRRTSRIPSGRIRISGWRWWRNFSTSRRRRASSASSSTT